MTMMQKPKSMICLTSEYFGAPVLESDESSFTFLESNALMSVSVQKVLFELARCYLTPPPTSVDVERLFGPAANIATDEQTFLPCFLCIVKSSVQMSGAGVRLILRSMSGSVQLKNLRLKSLTTIFKKKVSNLSRNSHFENKTLKIISPKIISVMFRQIRQHCQNHLNQLELNYPRNSV